MMQEHFNMSCGQTELTEPCKSNMGKDTITIYSPFFWDMEETVVSSLKEMLFTDNDIVIVFGTGTSGIEACLNSILETGDRFLIARNGLFGEIMTIMTTVAGAEPVRVDFDIGQPVDPKRIRSVLEKQKNIKGIGVVHSETSVGVKNPIQAVGEIAAEHDILFLVDAISSFASEELFVDKWNIDLCVVNGQKCLGAPQGNTFVSVSNRAWDAMQSRKSKIRGFYMNLLACRDYINMAHVEQKNWKVGKNTYNFELQEAPHPASPTFNIIQGVYHSLNQLKSEGIDKCIERHRIAGRAVRSALKAMGLQYMCRDDNAADNAVTALYLPDRIEDFQIRKHLYENYGVILGDANMMSWDAYRRQIGKSYVRFGNMGEAAHYCKVLYGIFALGMALRDLGAHVDVEGATRAVREVYSVVR
jgi:alanine-glyoxylate transaminase/serine-glyoxylate transaminase/serine-pyruvate transaminase